LELRERPGIVTVNVRYPDEGNLGKAQTYACSIEPVAHSSDDHRHKEQVEELEAVCALGPDDNPERNGYEQNVE
jgi:hypothetical protein